MSFVLTGFTKILYLCPRFITNLSYRTEIWSLSSLECNDTKWGEYVERVVLLRNLYLHKLLMNEMIMHVISILPFLIIIDYFLYGQHVERIIFTWNSDSSVIITNSKKISKVHLKKNKQCNQSDLDSYIFSQWETNRYQKADLPCSNSFIMQVYSILVKETSWLCIKNLFPKFYLCILNPGK